MHELGLGAANDVKRVPEFLKRVKDKEGGVRLMGFGHRVYKNYDPRATIIKRMCDKLLANPVTEDYEIAGVAAS